MRQLPLFPLKTVLFPGMPLRLHVFEPRYRLMIRDCLERDSTFGVALIVAGEEAGGPLPSPHRVGCIAQISYLEPLGDDRSNLLAIGGPRFRITAINRRGPYLVGQVRPLEIHIDSPSNLREADDRLRPLFGSYISLLADLGLASFSGLRLPSEPLSLVYTVSAALHIPLADKQDLLAINDACALFDRVGSVVRREMALLHILAGRGRTRLEESASLN
jgi:Lon protease-like protein